jgi:tRNA(Ile)-lysidine synthase
MLADRVRRVLERESLIPPGARVVAAVSGGSDSVALAYLLRDLGPALGFTLAGLAHLNHQLRGADSDADEHFCRQLAKRTHVRIDVQRTDVGAAARAQRVSVEVAARRVRYRFLERAALRLDADIVATGHTRDDQAETFLLRLLRGAGATGLAAIPPRRGIFVRPLLEERREDLRAYLAERGGAYREDATNADTRILRNWVRHELLPLLGARLGGDPTDLLAREAAILRDDAAMLEAVAEQAARDVIAETDSGVVMAAAELMSLPPALARRVIRRALARTSPAFQGADHAERVLDLARPGREDTSVDLPGVRLERNGGRVVLHTREGRGRRRPAGFRYLLPVPGRVVLPDADAVVEADLHERDPQRVLAEQVGAGATAAAVDAAVAAEGLWVRSRKPGDAYHPLGLGGRKKLQDVFVDRKVPRERRDHVPIVVDARDRIVWVAGLGPSDDARVTDRTQSVVTLRLRELGETG